MTAAKATLALAFLAGIRTGDSHGHTPLSPASNNDSVDAAFGLAFEPPSPAQSSLASDWQLLPLSASDHHLGYVIQAPTGNRVFLLGDPPPPDCEPALKGEYGSVAQRSLNMICPEDNGNLTAHATYHFSQDPNHTYLERGPRDTAASLCLFPQFDPFKPVDTSGIFEGTELVQPWSMYRFAYVDKCLADSPTSSPQQASTRAPTTAAEQPADESSIRNWAVTAAAGVGLAGSLVVCAFRGRLNCVRPLFQQVHPEAAIELGVPG